MPKIRLNLKLFLQFCAIFRKVFMLSLNFNYHQKFHVFIKFIRQILHKKNIREHMRVPWTSIELAIFAQGRIQSFVLMPCKFDERQSPTQVQSLQKIQQIIRQFPMPRMRRSASANVRLPKIQTNWAFFRINFWRKLKISNYFLICF